MKIAKNVLVVRPNVDKDYYLKAMRDFNFKSWSKMPSELVQNKDYCKDNKNRTTLYRYLCSRIIRKKLRYDPLDIYNNYFKENYLACSITMLELSKTFGFKGKNMITKWIKELEESGLLIIHRVLIDKHRTRNIYILGVHDNFEDYYFIYDKYKVGTEMEPKEGTKMEPKEGTEMGTLE